MLFSESLQALNPDFWKDRPNWDLVSFHAKYTLHDSSLVLVSSSTYEVSCLVQWDLVWNSSIPKNHDLLAFWFRQPYSVSWTQGAHDLNIIEGSESTLFSREEREQLLNSERFPLKNYQGRDSHIEHPSFDLTLTETKIYLLFGGEVNILHGALVSIAALSEKMEVHEIIT